MMDVFDKAMEYEKEGNYEDALICFKKAIEEGINIPEAKKWVVKLEKGEKESSIKTEGAEDGEMSEEKEETPAPAFTKSGFRIEINVTPMNDKAPKEYVGMKKKYGGGAKQWLSENMSSD